MDYSKKLSYHFKPQKGWINDPNGLVYFKGYYHVFYQHCPNFEVPKKEAVYWGHARTKDFISWEELPVALSPDKSYDNEGCWSGTAIVKDDMLYLFYASVTTGTAQSVSIAYSKDGINFEKYEKNPVIKTYPEDGGPDFRDPAVCFIDGKYRLVMATGHKETKKGRLLIYESEDLFNWSYGGIIAEWDDSVYTECPSLIDEGDRILLAASVCKTNWKHFFNVMYGKLENGKFKAEFHTKAKMLTPDQVCSLIGHSIGGVCPFGINEGVRVFLDESLKRFETVFPACGSSNSAIELNIEELEKYSRFEKWVDVCKIPEEN